MSNRLLFIMTAAVLLGIGALFALNLSSILSGSGTAQRPQNYIKNTHVRGTAVKHNDLLYTLNFQQQNEVLNYLNASIKIARLEVDNLVKPEIQQIVIYPFGKRETIEITPVTYIDNELVYSAPQWFADGFLKDVSNGQLRQLLSQTYDP